MKATLEFTLPEESHEHADAVNGPKWHSVAADMDEWLRHGIKYNGQEWETVRAHLSAIIQEYGLELHE